MRRKEPALEPVSALVRHYNLAVKNCQTKNGTEESKAVAAHYRFNIFKTPTREKPANILLAIGREIEARTGNNPVTKDIAESEIEYLIGFVADYLEHVNAD